MSATLVELIDGRVVTRDAEEWRHQCLAQHVLRLPGRAIRAEWLSDFERRHGASAADRLKATIQALHAKGRAA